MNINDGIAYRFGRLVSQHFDAKSIVIGCAVRETSTAFVAAALKAFRQRF